MEGGSISTEQKQGAQGAERRSQSMQPRAVQAPQQPLIVPEEVPRQLAKKKKDKRGRQKEKAQKP